MSLQCSIEYVTTEIGHRSCYCYFCDTNGPTLLKYPPEYTALFLSHPVHYAFSTSNRVWKLQNEYHSRFDAIPSRLITVPCSLTAVCTTRRRRYWWYTLPAATVLRWDPSELDTEVCCTLSALCLVLWLSASKLCSTVSSHATEVFTVDLSDRFLKRSPMKWFLHRKYKKKTMKWVVIICCFQPARRAVAALW